MALLYNPTMILDHLICDFNKTIRDPVWKDIKLSIGFWNLCHTQQMQKLDRIRQLGPTVLLYPGAVHTRLSHSLGVYHLSRLILISLISKGHDIFTMKGACSFLAAAMMHDLGHFPYAHSLKDVVTQEHEALGASIIQDSPELLDALSTAGADPEWVMAVIDKRRPLPCDEVALYRSMLSGTLDPDKLDYLCRDAFFCGVPYGVQDVSYIIDQIDVSKLSLCMNSSSMASIEHILFSKYMMYKSVYWHKKVRCATAMIKKALVDAMGRGIIQEQELFGLDDWQFHQLCEAKRIPLLSLVNRVWNNQLLEEESCFPYEEGFDAKAYERELAARNPGKAVIVDIPEPISFESALLISDKAESFIDCDPVFNRQTIGGFKKSLRMVRVFKE